MKNCEREGDRLRKALADAYCRVIAGNGHRPDGRPKGQATGEDAGLPDHLRTMEAAGQLADGIAQDYGRVLALVMGYGGYMNQELDEKDPMRSYVQRILASSEKVATLTRGLLAFARKQVARPKRTDVNDVIRRAGRLVARVVGEGIDFRTRLSGRRLQVFADPVQLEQVVMNVAANARDAMAAGGTLTVETKELRVGGAPADNGAGEWKCAVISFTDTGLGMSDEVRRRIFDPFFTTKDPATSAGLGLSVAHGIIKQHSGSINVTSEPGLGTTLSVYLPLMETRDALESAGRVAAPAPVFSSAHLS